jgi:hypothetical protein
MLNQQFEQHCRRGACSGSDEIVLGVDHVVKIIMSFTGHFGHFSTVSMVFALVGRFAPARDLLLRAKYLFVAAKGIHRGLAPNRQVRT